jgi:hypothetical protein
VLRPWKNLIERPKALDYFLVGERAINRLHAGSLRGSLWRI